MTDSQDMILEAYITQDKNGTYEGYIKYADGDIAATTAPTASDVHQFMFEHGVLRDELEVR